MLLLATNRLVILDSGPLHAKRFHRQVLVDCPDKAGSIADLKVHLQKAELDHGIDLEQIAALTPGFTGAALADLVNEAAPLAAAAAVAMKDFSNADLAHCRRAAEAQPTAPPERTRDRRPTTKMGHVLVAKSQSSSNRLAPSVHYPAP